MVASAAAVWLTEATSGFVLADSAKANYISYCATCHGNSGNADGPTASQIRTRPAKLADCARMSKVSDGTLFKVIEDGGSAAHLSNDMPAWNEVFAPPDIKKLVAYIRTFCKK
ncbi:MAG TPA: cytochrome c [Candidatus Binataceae bacterium]|nr:cytochrome c [Candidatus Binataceae bacterium]